MNQVKNKDFTALLLLLLAGVLFYLPFISINTFGERDSYRVAIGIIDSIRSNQYLSSPLLYGVDKSFAYFAFINLFSPLFKEQPGSIIPFLNYLNAFASIILVIPYYFLIKKYWGINIAILTNIFLMSVPVWRQTSLYGHPMVFAMLMMIFGLFLISIRCRINTTLKNISLEPILLEVSIVSSLALCLMMRLDAVILFLLIPGLLVFENIPYRQIIIRSTIYILLPIIIFFVFKTKLPELSISDVDVNALDASASFFKQLLFWHNLSRFKDNFFYGSRLFLSAFNHLYVLFFICSLIFFWRKRKKKEILFILPLFLFNYLFWLPNPDPARHFIYAAPIFALAIAIFLKGFVDSLQTLLANKKLIKIAAISSLAFLLVISNFGRYEPPYFLENVTANDLNRIGKHLQNIKNQENPILVLADDMIPSILDIQITSEKTRVFPEYPDIPKSSGTGEKISLFVFDNGVNKFVSFAYNDLPHLVEDAIRLLDNIEILDDLEKYRGINVFIDPELKINNFPRNKFGNRILPAKI